MLLFEYQEHFSSSENLLQVPSGMAVHHTSGNVAPLAAMSAWLRWYTLYQETWFPGRSPRDVINSMFGWWFPMTKSMACRTSVGAMLG